ncbi:MAG: hypothetical protein HDR43_02060 [Mycoplasma sp.]|nr:hypothetical protein [Mycoplasma sp.]
MNIVTLLIAMVVCFVMLFTSILDRQTSIIISSIIWLLPLYSITISIIWFFKFKSSKSKLQNLDLYNRITNQAIRDKILKSHARIKYLLIKKNQEQDFFKAIESEIEKQKKLLAIKKGQYR